VRTFAAADPALRPAPIRVEPAAGDIFDPTPEAAGPGWIDG
jgi:hypothetical protein